MLNYAFSVLSACSVDLRCLLCVAVRREGFEVLSTHLINPKYYWGYKTQTFRDWLIERTDESFWEHKERWDTRGTQHPNLKGYKLIGEELANFINDVI